MSSKTGIPGISRSKRFLFKANCLPQQFHVWSTEISCHLIKQCFSHGLSNYIIQLSVAFLSDIKNKQSTLCRPEFRLNQSASNYGSYTLHWVGSKIITIGFLHLSDTSYSISQVLPACLSYHTKIFCRGQVQWNLQVGCAPKKGSSNGRGKSLS